MNKQKKIILTTCVIIGTIISSLFFIFNVIVLPRVDFDINDVKIDDFAYFINDIDKETVKESCYDLFIIDYSSDGSEENEFSSKDVKYMKSSGDKEKLLLSYISIGEAENYRFYWNESWDEDEDGEPDASAPSWLDEVNPDWEGNYKVKFWEAGWQNIIYDYLDRIISADFDGIYMDILDAYEYFEDDVSDSDWLMMDFVCNISAHVKDEGGKEFLVFAQNADELLSNSTYLDNIDGIGREDLFFNDDEAMDAEWREEGTTNLDQALENEKVVLIVDYPVSLCNIYDFYKRTVEHGYIPYAGERELNNIKEQWYYAAT